MTAFSEIIVIFILLLFSGFFSAAEAALLSLTDLHLHKMKTANYPFLGLVNRLLDNPRRLLITIVTSNEAVNISISILAASFFIGLLGVHGQLVSIIVTSVILFLAGEAIPKTFGVTYPMAISSAVSPILFLVAKIESPVVAALDKTPGLIIKGLSQKKSWDADVLMEDEFKSLIDAGIREGVVDEAQKELIKRIFESGDRPVTDIMVPRVEMFCLPLSMPANEIVSQVVMERHERVPIYTEDKDDITGILFARDLLDESWPNGQATEIDKLLSPPYFVPETKTIDGLLRDFQENGMQMAIVVDEYGGVSGLVTLEDILIYLFEEAYGNYGSPGDGFEKVDENTVVVSGRMPLDNLTDMLGIEASLDEFDTVGGFVLHLLGKLPERGEEISYGGYIFRVEVVGRTRILKVRIEKEKPVEQNKEK